MMSDLERIAQLLETERVTHEERRALIAALDTLDHVAESTWMYWPILRFTFGRRRFRELRTLLKGLGYRGW